jgi:DNA-3-methyladenine glycosylase I
MSDVIAGEDGLVRCPWGASTPEYQTYHDHEWGMPVGDDNRVLEKLCLEGFQA